MSSSVGHIHDEPALQLTEMRSSSNERTLLLPSGERLRCCKIDWNDIKDCANGTGLIAMLAFGLGQDFLPSP
jgi:hypothetical protein